MDNRLQKVIQPLRAACEGKLEGLRCPECNNETVEVRFTNPETDVYRQWFLCSSCKFQHRVQVKGCPQHYSEKRRDLRLEAYDRDILAKCIFPIPPEAPE